VQVAVLDVAHKAADRAPDLATKGRRVKLNLDEAALNQ
jgi:hypothetical protein